MLDAITDHLTMQAVGNELPQRSKPEWETQAMLVSLPVEIEIDALDSVVTTVDVNCKYLRNGDGAVETVTIESLEAVEIGDKWVDKYGHGWFDKYHKMFPELVAEILPQLTRYHNELCEAVEAATAASTADYLRYGNN